MQGEIPFLPYAGTSGWSGSETSRKRAVDADGDGTTGANQRQVLAALALAMTRGRTWRDLSEEYGWHHGTASGVLSVLHKSGQIVRLKETRNRCKVYVLPEYAAGREVEAHGRKAHPCANCGYQEGAA